MFKLIGTLSVLGWMHLLFKSNLYAFSFQMDALNVFKS